MKVFEIMDDGKIFLFIFLRIICGNKVKYRCIFINRIDDVVLVI